MNKIIIHKEDSTNLQKWLDSNNNDVNTTYCPFKDIELIFQECKDNPNRYLKLKCYRKDTYVNIYVSVDGVDKGRLRVNLKGEIIQNKLAGNLSNSQLDSMYGAYFTIMEYIAKYKPENTLEIKESKNVKSRHRNSKKTVTNTTYLFRSFRGGNHSKRHTNPSCSFSVRGHYRHLKNGKTIWIKEYIKHADKPRKDKTYKL